MKKTSILLVGILGIILLIVGIIFNPSFAGNLTSDSSIDSGIRTAQIHLFQYYAIVFGILLIIFSSIIYFLPEAKKKSSLVLGFCAIGIVLTIMGIIFSPSFIEKNLTPVGFLTQEHLSFFTNLQVIIISLGCLILLISLWVYSKMFLSHPVRFGITFTALTILLFFSAMYGTYISTTYPINILMQPSKYGKVVDLLLGRDILLTDYDPISYMKVDNETITKAKYPVIDIHFHFYSEFKTEYDKKVLSPKNLIKSMDSLNIQTIVNLDSDLGDMEGTLNLYARPYPDRFINFYPRWFPANIVTDEYMAGSGARLKEMVEMGARGLKIWKYLGIKTRDTDGDVLHADDPRLDNMWAMAGKLNIPVLWHFGDPASTFQPVDKHSERFEQLRDYPKWSYYSLGVSRDSILKQRENVLKRFPNTIFIGAHMGQNPEDLGYISYLLDTYPNYYVEISSVVGELGRQPYTAREFFIKYQDRILFGTDGGSLFGVEGWTVEKFYQAYFEFLETDNEYFPYPLQGAINQGNWKIYGIYLPDEVLKKIYHDNAAKILSMFDPEVLK